MTDFYQNYSYNDNYSLDNIDYSQQYEDNYYDTQQFFPPCPGGFIYTVVPGDTLFIIAQRFNVTLAAILAANPQVVDPGFIFPGQQICIPGAISPIPPQPPFPPTPRPPFPPVVCPRGTFRYTVRFGDTLPSIAARFGVTVAAIIRVNPRLIPGQIFPGQIICIPRRIAPIPPVPPFPPVPPVPPIRCPGGFFYTVRPGDTLLSISARFRVPILAIIQANPHLTLPVFLFPGQVICIPRTRRRPFF